VFFPTNSITWYDALVEKPHGLVWFGLVAVWFGLVWFGLVAVWFTSIIYNFTTFLQIYLFPSTFL